MHSSLSASRLARQALQRSLAGPSSQRLALSTSSANSCACRSAAPRGPSISRSIARAGAGAGELAAARSAVASRWAAQQKREQASRHIRAFHSSPVASHGGIKRPEPGTGIKVTFRDSKGKDIRTVEVNEGDDLLSIAHEYDIDLEGEYGRNHSLPDYIELNLSCSPAPALTCVMMPATSTQAHARAR